jgi:hypothetical protein
MRLLPLPAVALALPVSAAKPPQVEYRNDRLTVHAEAAPVADILNEIKSQSGAEVRGEPPAAAPLTIDLEAVPLREALERPIGQQSFTLRSIRIQAWRAAMRALEADVDRRNALIAAVGAMDDTELTVFSRALASMTPDGAEDLAKLVARDTTVPELLSRARDVLRQLRLERTAMAAGS